MKSRSRCALVAIVIATAMCIGLVLALQFARTDSSVENTKEEDASISTTTARRKKRSDPPTTTPSQAPTRYAAGDGFYENRDWEFLPSSTTESPSTSKSPTYPTILPSDFPSFQQSYSPTSLHSSLPSLQPSSLPSLMPSKQPSPFPTSSPSFPPSQKPSSQPTAFPTSLPCIDDPSYTFELDNGNQANCAWFTNYPRLISFRRYKYCDEPNTAFNCRWSCGTCSTELNPLPIDDEEKTGEWETNYCSFMYDSKDLYKTLKMQDEYCDVKMANKKRISDKCPLTCGYLDTESSFPKGSMKKGIIINPKVDEASMKHFTDSISWFYNYKSEPVNWEGAWADLNGVEHVPMITGNWLVHPGSIEKKCYFEDYGELPTHRDKSLPICTTQDAIDAILEAKRNRQNGVPIRYLMGFNEMYNNPHPEDFTPDQAAYYWAKYVQPAALAAGLKLVSTTFNAKSSDWTSEFFMRCYDRRKDKDYPCDIDLIEMFAVHQYDCKQELWEQWYGHGESKFINGVSNKLGQYGGKKDWKEYLQSKPFWVTETNCYHDIPDLSKPGKFERPHASSKEMCLRISGQRPKIYGIGSIATMEQLDTIDRYAFWTTWSPKKTLKPVHLTYKDGTITPVGRAYLNPGDTSIDCEFSGKVIKVDDKQAKLEGEAKMMSCAGTGGTAMVRKLHLGNVSFTVDVPKAGDYALNISYMSKEIRPLYVKVNDQKKAQRFFFPETGGWCFEDGKSTVVPMELSGFNKGDNTITFGNADETGEEAPMIEWISVVM